MSLAMSLAVFMLFGPHSHFQPCGGHGPEALREVPVDVALTGIVSEGQDGIAQSHERSSVERACSAAHRVVYAAHRVVHVAHARAYVGD